MVQRHQSGKRHVFVRRRKKWRRRIRQRCSTTEQKPSSALNGNYSLNEHEEAGQGNHDTSLFLNVQDTAQENRAGILSSDIRKERCDENCEGTGTSQVRQASNCLMLDWHNREHDNEWRENRDEEDMHNFSVNIEYNGIDTDTDPTITYPHERDCGRNALEKELLHDHVLSGLCLIIGRSRTTVNQYQCARSLINYEGCFGRREGYPSYTMLCSTILPLVRRYVYIPTRRYKFNVDSKRAGAEQPRVNAVENVLASQKEIKVIFPSSWAKKDVMTISLFSSASEVSTAPQIDCGSICHANIELTPILGLRLQIFRSNVLQFMTSHRNVFISDYEVNEGDTVDLVLYTPHDHLEKMLGTLGARSTHQHENKFMSLEGKLHGSSLQQNEDRNLIAGDVVSTVHFSNPRNQVIILLVHRMKRTHRQPSQAIIIRTVDGTKPDLSVRCLRLGRPVNAPLNIDRSPSLPHVSAYGKLRDGRFYSVHRDILYSDDFQQFASKEGSAGGCYMLPVNLPLHQKRGSGSVRVISLTPPGISTNRAFMSIVPDIVSATKTGIETVDYFGVKRTVFIKVIGYIGDYVAVHHVQDLAGPNGIAPCSLCVVGMGFA